MPRPNIKDSTSERPSITLVQLNRSLEKEQKRSNNIFQEHLSSSSSCLMAVVTLPSRLVNVRIKYERGAENILQYFFPLSFDFFKFLHMLVM